MISITTSLSAQQVFEYTGTVYDVVGEALPGVNVIEKGTSNGTVTNIDGNFRLESENENITITFSMIGYKATTFAAEPGKVIKLTLKESIVGLDEVVVIGYGTEKRANVTGAISKMNASQIAEIPVTSVNEALQGRLAGVNVTNNSGSPGAGLKVIIRGVGYKW